MLLKRLFTLALLLLAASAAQATVRTVKAGGGGDCTVIQTCVNLMAAGDTTTVFAGTYNEVVTISAGTAGNYKTVQVNTGDTVNVFGFVQNSHTKVIGFTITNPASPNSALCISIATNATDGYTTNNTMTQCGNTSAMLDAHYTSGGESFWYIQGNSFSWGCTTPAIHNVCEAMLISGNHFLIENNDISHVSDGVTLYASFTVFRNNTMHDTGPGDCGSQSSNCHIDMVESEPTSITPASNNNLYEGNYQTTNTGANAHVFLTQADTCPGGAANCKNTIVRFDHANLLGTYWLLDNLGNYSHVKDYNNTIVCALNGSSCGVSGVDQNVTSFNTSTNGAEVNNIYYNSTPPTNSGLYYSGGPPFRANNNLAFCTTPCTFISPYSTESGRVLTNPNFVNPASDWHLQAGSPAIGTGANLTTAVGAGSGSTSLTVADSDYFQDSLGLSAVGVQADWIRIGASTTVQISSINYSTNVITLASPVSWNNGDAVNLYKNSSGTVVLNPGNPDIGAFPFSGSAPAVSLVPTSLNLGSRVITTTSNEFTTTLTNTGTATLTITSITLTGTNPGDYTISSNTCGGSLGAGLNCVVGVKGTPGAVGARTANLTFTTNASTSPDNVTLTISGLAFVGGISGAGTISGAGVTHN